MKLAVIGAGSTYTPELVSGLAALDVEELALHDIADERREVVGAHARRLLARTGFGGRLEITGDLVRGLDGADFVLIQIRVGGQEARLRDETLPLPCGCIGQETTGPGGFAKALRTVPVVLEVAEAVRKHAKPDAWIIDFTNPVGIVTRALLEAGHRAVGLCNVAIGFQRNFATMLGVAPEQVALGHVGLNHLTWERSITVDGVDRLPGLLADRLPALAEEVELPPHLLELLGVVPSYYLRYYYAHDEVLHEQLNSPTRADAVQEVERRLLELYADPSVNEKPAELAKRGGAFYSEAAVDLMSSLVSNRGDVQVVNLRNDGSLPFRPDDHVIEVPARITSAGLKAEPIAALDDDIRGLISAVAGYERLALDAAVHGGRDRVLRAMQAHPLVLQYERAEKLTDLLLDHNRQHLAWAK